MSSAVAEMACVLHALPGRMRIHIPGWSGQGKRAIETTLSKVQGVDNARANALTGNILIEFDPAVTTEQAILAVIQTLTFDTTSAPEEEPAPPPVIHERLEKVRRAHIAVRGIDRDPYLAKRVVEYLERRPGVRATARQLTGRVLVEFSEHETDLDDLLADVADVELPALPEEDRPDYPLDPAPLIQSVVRTIGSALGLTLLATRQLTGATEPLPGAAGSLRIASIIGILHGIHPIRYGLRRLLGRTTADLLINIPGIITLTLANSPLGLALIGCESVRLLTEIQARRKAWREYEQREKAAPVAHSNAIIHLEAGKRSPLAAKVIEGTGTAIGRDSLPLPVLPGSTIPPGAWVYGGPFTVRFEGEETFQAFTPEPHPIATAPAFYRHYLQVVSSLSLISAGTTAVLTRSFDQTLSTLLLINPRVAAIGLESADLSAAARVIRAGVIVVGTRKNRPIRRPDYLLLDGSRTVTHGIELSNVLPLTEEYESATLVSIAAGISRAAGSPWGNTFKGSAIAQVTAGFFDSRSACATFEGRWYRLGPIEDWSLVPEASNLRQRGKYVLALYREDEQRPLGVFALSPRLAPGVAELVHTCQRHKVQLAMLTAGDQIVAREIAQRTGIALLIEITLWKLFKPGRLKGCMWRLFQIRRAQQPRLRHVILLSVLWMIADIYMRVLTCSPPT